MVKKISNNIGILFLYFIIFSLISYSVYLYSVEYFIAPGCPSNPSPNFKTCPYPPIRGSKKPDPTCPEGQFSEITGGPCSLITNSPKEKPSTGSKEKNCNTHKSCGPCSNSSGCVWCNDIKKCLNSDRNGFPLKTQLTKYNSRGCKGNNLMEFPSDCPSNRKQDIREKGYNTVNSVTGYDPNPSRYPVYHKKFPIKFSRDEYDGDLTDDEEYVNPKKYSRN